MSSQAFPPQGGGGGTTTKTNMSSAGGTTTAITVKANATAPTTNNGKDMPKTDGARTQLLADKQEGPRVVVQPAYPPMSMPKSFAPSPPVTATMATATKVTIGSTVATTVAIKTPTCYIIPATKGPQGVQATDIAKATTTIATKVGCYDFAKLLFSQFCFCE